MKKKQEVNAFYKLILVAGTTSFFEGETAFTYLKE